MTRVWFFGCWGGYGHYMWTPERRQVTASVWRTALQGARAATFIDGGVMPDRPGVWAHGFTDDTPLAPGWTYLSAQDNTVDHRGGSHATFLAEGHHDRDAMRALVIANFPEVCKRVGLASEGGAR